MTLANLRLLIASAACAALTAPVWAQDEEPAETPETEGEEAVEAVVDPSVYEPYGVAPPEDLDLYAPPSGLEVILMSGEQLVAEAEAALTQLDVCEARFAEVQGHLAEVPEELELVYAEPLFGADAVALRELEIAAAAAAAAAEAAAAEAEAAAAEGEDAAEGEEAGEAEAAAEEPPVEDAPPEAPLAPPTAPGAETAEAEAEEGPPEAPTFGVRDVLNEYDEVIATQFVVHPIWTAELLGCGINVDGAAGHLSREAARRGYTIDVLDAGSERIQAHVAEAFLILPQREIPPPLPPEEEAAEEGDTDAEGEAVEGEEAEGEGENGEAEGENGETTEEESEE